MEKESKGKTSIGDKNILKIIITYINIVLSITGFGSLISGIINSLGYIIIPPKYPVFIFCISIAFYLLLNIESIIESKKKTQILIYSIAIGLVLVSILNFANWGADFKPDVKINLPHKAYIEEDIIGTATNIPDGYKLWILVYPNTAQKYYPQHDSIKIQDGKWSIKIRLGNENNTGEKFDIVAIIADEKANNELESYMDSCANGYCPGLYDLPEGTSIKDSIEVTRI